MNDQIYITYPAGRMELVLDRFFPCPIREARIIFPLIRTYAQESEKEKLRRYLLGCAKEAHEAMKKMEEDYRRRRRRPGRNYKHLQTIEKRALRNLQFLEE